jgi:small subunit ribosomal protein S1
VRVKILEIESERRRLSLSVKRVQDQLEHIRSATAAGAAASGAEDLGDVPDLGLSEDVFAGPQVSGAEDLRAAVAEAQETEDVPAAEAETVDQAEPEPDAPAAEAEAGAEAGDAEGESETDEG